MTSVENENLETLSIKQQKIVPGRRLLNMLYDEIKGFNPIIIKGNIEEVK